jgi:hypothetical protein
MATREEIKKAILRVAGNPSSGVIHALADDFAQAIAELDAPRKVALKDEGTRETRVVGATEIR